MKFLNEHTRILKGIRPVDMNNRMSEGTAVELDLPDNFSDKAKACWDYFEGAAFIFEYYTNSIFIRTFHIIITIFFSNCQEMFV